MEYDIEKAKAFCMEFYDLLMKHDATLSKGWVCIDGLQINVERSGSVSNGYASFAVEDGKDGTGHIQFKRGGWTADYNPVESDDAPEQQDWEPEVYANLKAIGRAVED